MSIINTDLTGKCHEKECSLICGLVLHWNKINLFEASRQIVLKLPLE